jgi:DNA-directed RNA polymerase specialized sigma24 family protein
MNKNKVYTYHTTEELNDIVTRYREGDAIASQELIEAFAPITDKYVRLCTLGIWDKHDKDIRHFLSMLGGDDLQTTVEELVILLKAYDPEDINQEAVLALLTTARKYTAIASNFKYVFKRQLKDLVKDPLVCKTVETKQAGIFRDIDTYKSAQDEEVEINMSWVNGITTGEGWDRLTPLQRAIIKMIYADGFTETVAAEVLHIGTERTLRNHLSAAKKVLAKFFRDDIRRLR